MGEARINDKEKLRDSRTNFPERESFYREVPPLMADAEARNGAVVLLDIDIDGIDFALRIFGPQDRDALIREVGRCLEDATGGEVTPFHINQGRFALILPDVSHRRATREAQAVVEAFREPFDVAGAPYRLEPHVGISRFPSHAGSLSELVRTSVFACHQAREQHVGYAIFDHEWDERDRERFRLMVDLERALEDGDQLCLAYQPKVDVVTGECVGVEALCRWHHPQLGFIPPGKFLPFVEHTSLILPLTERVFADGLADLAHWQQRGFEGDLAVNLSPVLFREPDLLDRILEHFRFSGVDPAKLHFEVTETGIMEQPNQGAHTLARIRDRGSRVSIDDFGTGHSSLAYIADLPIDSLKIDKHFIQSLEQPWGEAIVGAATTLAGKLGLTTIAEGVEDEAQLRQCRELGCQHAQGFHTGRPMFREDFRAWAGLEGGR